MEILKIFDTVILPLFIIIAFGVFFQRRFNIDRRTMSKLNLYYLVPSIIFVKIYETKLSLSLFAHVILALIIQVVVIFIISQVVGRVMKMKKGSLASFSNSVVLTNNGNFGIPVNQLAYPNDPLALSVQIVALAFNNFLTFTFGLFNAGAGDKGIKSSLKEFFKIPMFYALLLGILLNVSHIKLPNLIWIPINNAANGFIAIALLTLGIQVASLKFRKNIGKVLLSSGLRLIVGPLVGLAIIFLLGIHGTMAKALLMASGLPTSRNSAILALEYGNESEFAAQAVIVSTFLSGLTITLVIYVGNLLF